MPPIRHETLRFGPHRLDLKRQQLWTGDAPVALQPKAWALLLLLLDRPGELLTAEELLNTLWPQGDVTPKALTNRIVELRKALGDDLRAPRLIQTVHRRGYRLLLPVSRADDASEPAVAPAQPPAPEAEPAALRFTQAPAAGAALAGREAEQALLAHQWALAGQGRRRLVLLAGEAGMGKSALAEAFAQAVLTQHPPGAGDYPAARVLLGRGPSLQQSAEREALAPLLALVADWANGPARALVVPLLRRCAPSWLLQLPWLCEEAEAAQWSRSLAGAGTARMLREGCAFFEELAQHRTVLLLLEDLHWADAATVDLLDLLAQGQRPARLIVLGTLQPAAASHPVLARSRRMLAQGRLTERVLGPLTLPEVQAHLAARFGSPVLAQELATRVMRVTGATPCSWRPCWTICWPPAACASTPKFGFCRTRTTGPTWACPSNCGN